MPRLFSARFRNHASPGVSTSVVRLPGHPTGMHFFSLLLDVVFAPLIVLSLEHSRMSSVYIGGK